MTSFLEGTVSSGDEGSSLTVITGCSSFGEEIVGKWGEGRSLSTFNRFLGEVGIGLWGDDSSITTLGVTWGVASITFSLCAGGGASGGGSSIIRFRPGRGGLDDRDEDNGFGRSGWIEGTSSVLRLRGSGGSFGEGDRYSLHEGARIC